MAKKLRFRRMTRAELVRVVGTIRRAAAAWDVLRELDADERARVLVVLDAWHRNTKAANVADLIEIVGAAS